MTATTTTPTDTRAELRLRPRDVEQFGASAAIILAGLRHRHQEHWYRNEVGYRPARHYIPITRVDLGELSGVTLSTVGTVLKKLRRQNIISATPMADIDHSIYKGEDVPVAAGDPLTYSIAEGYR